MGLFDFLKSEKTKDMPVQDSPVNAMQPKQDVTMYGGHGMYGYPAMVYDKIWDGEKTLGELGDVVVNVPDYQRLRLRALDAYTKTDIVKTISSRFFQWVIGSGLKLETEPNDSVLTLEGISFDKKKFKETAEARFLVYSNTTYPDYSRQKNLHGKAMDAYTEKFFGDCLVVCRIEDEGISVQTISGAHVRTPLEADLNPLENGNYIKHGIEFNSRGEHVAYYVAKRIQEKDTIEDYERISAYGEKTKRRLAWMIYGQKLSPDHLRGVPEISQVLEKVNKLDRYNEASVSKAEQAAKLVYTIEHLLGSTGENPLNELLAKKFRGIAEGEAAEVMDAYKIGNNLAQKIAQTTSGQAINLPPGAKFSSFNTDIESSFEQFYQANYNSICASINIPPEVALQMYNSNYSASRAAINGWGYIVDIARKQITDDFYKPFYKLWLEVEILKNKIEAPGFILALNKRDFMVTESYAQCRFIGKNMPHIDPLKEVKAVRAMLGDETTPLISREQGTEMLNAGSWFENIENNLEESKILPKTEIDANSSTTKSPNAGLEQQAEV